MTARIADKQAVAERERLVRGSASKAPACADGGFAFQGRPAGLAVAPDGTVLVSDATSRSILRISAGDAPAVAAGPASVIPGTARRRVLSPAGLAVAADGSVIVADTTGHRIWAVSPAGSLRLVAGSVYGYRDGPGAEAQFRFPSGVAIGKTGPATWPTPAATVSGPSPPTASSPPWRDPYTTTAKGEARLPGSAGPKRSPSMSMAPAT